MRKNIPSLVLLATALFGLCLAQQCPQGQAPINGNCAPVNYIEGCFTYHAKDKCDVCEYNYDLVDGLCNYNEKDQRKCCISFGKDGSCAACEKGLFLEDGACKQAYLLGCIAKDGAICQNCASDFYLKDDRCVRAIEGCVKYSKDGACQGCDERFILDRGTCLPIKVTGCKQQQQGKCIECYKPFTAYNGKCVINDCDEINDYGCVACRTGFYLQKDGLCYPVEKGCQSYRRGECVSCSYPYKLENGKCVIEGCTAYTSTGECKSCSSPYQLIEGTCRIPNCLEAFQGKCHMCEAGYHLHSGQCLKPLQDCINYVGEICRECAPGFYLGADNHCRRYENGCTKYNRGQCQACAAPFVLDNGVCRIDGCDQSNNEGCIVCKEPYKLAGKVCKLDNCEKAENFACFACSQGYHLTSFKKCVKNIDGCLEYCPEGLCIKCKEGQYISPDGRQCLTREPGCIYEQGKCTKCYAPFKYADGACVLEGCSKFDFGGCVSCVAPYVPTPNRDCVIPSCYKTNGNACVQCIEGYFPRKDGSCTKKIPDCLEYNDDKCSQCSEGFYVCASGLECHRTEPGCEYQNGRCKSCYKPFRYDNNGNCKILGCRSYDAKGCTECRAPFALTNSLTCEIPNCLTLGPNHDSCAECDTGYVALTSTGSCIRSIPNCDVYNGEFCKTCKKGYFVSEDKSKCIEEKPGCNYENGKCVSCKEPFAFKNGGCIIEGCLTYDYLGCTKCVSDEFILHDRICRLPNCAVIEDNKCKFCAKDYYLRNNKCVGVDKYCLKHDENNFCSECMPGFYLEKNGYCQKEKPGCNYINAEIVSCREPFTYDPTTKTCEIDGCLEYFDSGCKVCAKPYELDYNGCKLNRCIRSSKGRCLKCEEGFVPRNGVCEAVDPNCLKYNDDGECQSCKGGFQLTDDKFCIKREPGCVYTGSKCTSCYKPFVFNGKGCELEGCLKYTFEGCAECKYPYDLTGTNECGIQNCVQTANGVCVRCKSGFHAKKGICEEDDSNCLKYDDNTGNCLTCVKGYTPLEDGNCHFRDKYCVKFEGFNCVECDPQYYVNTKGTCSIRDKGCKTYKGGKCVECTAKHYLYENLCRPFKKGCLEYKGKNCVRCDEGYEMLGDVCVPKVRELNWNDIDMEDEFEDTVFAGGQKIITKYVNPDGLSPASAVGKLVFSSALNATTAVGGLDGFGWKAYSQAPGEYVGYLLSAPMTFYSVSIMAIDGEAFPTEFYIEYTLDGKMYRKINRAFTIDKCNSSAPVIINFTPVYATEIRIVIKSYHNWPGCKVEFYYSNGALRKKVAAPTTEIAKFISGAVGSKLEYQVDTNLRNFFNPARDCKSMESCWAGLDLCGIKTITKFELVEDKESKGKVTEYYIDYSTDGANFTCYNGCKPTDAKVLVFDKPISAKKVRVHPTKWTGEPAVKFNFEWK